MSSRTNRLFQNVSWMPTYSYVADLLLERIDWPSLPGFLSSRFLSYFRHAISFICQLGTIVKAPDWLHTSLVCQGYIIGTILRNLDFTSMSPCKYNVRSSSQEFWFRIEITLISLSHIQCWSHLLSDPDSFKSQNLYVTAQRSNPSECVQSRSPLLWHFSALWEETSGSALSLENHQETKHFITWS